LTLEAYFEARKCGFKDSNNAKSKQAFPTGADLAPCFASILG